MRSFQFLTLAAALAALSVGAPRSNAGTITGLFNTGVSGGTGFGTGSGAGDNTVDAHYSVISAPAGAPTGTTSLVVNRSATFPIPPWVSATTLPGFGTNPAEWTSGPNPGSSGPADPPPGGVPNGTYDYQTRFTTSDTGAISISGNLTADDRVVSILINGVAATTTGIPTTDQGYTAFYAFTATAPGTINGVNTIDFLVGNTNLVVEGLLVQFTGASTSTGVPEPASVVLLGSGLVGLVAYGGLRRRKKRVA
jgi:hypothetical protein